MSGKLSGRILAALAVLLLSVSAEAQIASPLGPSEVGIPLTHRVKFTSAINGKTYVLRIQVPSFAPPPPRGYPVVYVLDGDQFFGAATDINFSMSQHAVVVGIGYDLINEPAEVAKIIGRKPDDTSPIGAADIGRAGGIERFDDLTPPIAPENRKPAWQEPEKSGNLDTFLKVLETEIKPKAAAVAPIDASNATLFGHSAGGLAVLHALFTEPQAFRTFVAASPAIWWNARAVLADEKAFSKLVEAHGASPRILITVGSLEEPKNPRTITPEIRAFLDSLPPDRRAEVMAYKKKSDAWGGMVTNARNLGERLCALHGGKDYKAQFVLFEGEHHESSAFAALSRGMHFALEN
ncbi:MAG TPA: alpha/beta hydrolase-fold protein [Rhizomicrobium sp.]|nr:alpha/beta hydrolase-fold protein [Rhizomicrobium sp.]